MKGLIAFVLVTVCLSYALYKPMPESIEQPWIVRIYLLILNSILDLSFFADKMGLGSWPNIARTLFDAISYCFHSKSPPEGLNITDTVFDGVPVRIYQPPAADKKGEITGAIVYYHGGGWVWGSIHSYEPQTMALAMRVGVPVVSVGYRLAPEVTYPVPLNDCVSATVHFIRQATHYNVDPHRIAIMGDSAGGNLAAAVAIRLNQLSLPARPATQVLIYPNLQFFDFQLPSYQQNKLFPSIEGIVGHSLTHMGKSLDLMGAFLANNHTSSSMKREFAYLFDIQLLQEHYRSTPNRNLDGDGVPEVVERVRKYILDPFFAPLMAPPELVRGLPDTYVLTAGNDPMRDDGILYVKKLNSEGVRVRLVDYPEAHHPFLYQFDGLFAIRVAGRAFDEIVDYLRAKLDSG